MNNALFIASSNPLKRESSEQDSGYLKGWSDAPQTGIRFRVQSDGFVAAINDRAQARD